MTQGRCKRCRTRWVWWRDVKLLPEGMYRCPHRGCKGILSRTSNLCKDRVQVHPYHWLHADHTAAEILEVS